ncbi:hypothetical protein ACH46_08215 [Gordonia phthalatica]|uniref:Uncharacterized protein n=1 Tax=Gordonia phthalatica TaxID=1136941 RepID=A0A0N9MNX5_9ACTN|nr:hypothetical protein ACH46_08215 [Gordonia phthalatica]
MQRRPAMQSRRDSTSTRSMPCRAQSRADAARLRSLRRQRRRRRSASSADQNSMSDRSSRARAARYCRSTAAASRC